MSQTVYHVTMSDGQMRDVKGFSAAEAMSKALERNRGLTVTGCFAGNVDMTASHVAGRITYEIPPHKALPILDEE